MCGNGQKHHKMVSFSQVLYILDVQSAPHPSHHTQVKHHISSGIEFIHELPQSALFLLYFSDDVI